MNLDTFLKNPCARTGLTSFYRSILAALIGEWGSGWNF